MALRLGGLADLDPAAVPLPAGTEVVTRVDRIVDGELRPGGATGRVAKLDGDRVEIVFIDGRRATYLPRHADIGRAERILRAIRDEAARRWLERAPGPWGADAPPAPEARFDD